VINKFTNKYDCFLNIFKVRRLETRDNYFKGGVVEKRLETAVSALVMVIDGEMRVQKAS